MTKRYRITVIEIGQEVREVGGKWEPGAGPDGSYGYTPQCQAHRDYERTVFTQEVDEMNLPALVRNVNPETAQ